jgi:hypothetical protein
MLQQLLSLPFPASCNSREARFSTQCSAVATVSLYVVYLYTLFIIIIILFVVATLTLPLAIYITLFWWLQQFTITKRLPLPVAMKNVRT